MTGRAISSKAWRAGPRPALIVVALVALVGLTPACLSSEKRVPRVRRGERVTEELAWAATLSRDWDVAVARWNELFLRGSGDRVTACRETARALLELGDEESAERVLEFGLRRDPGHPELLEMRGNVLVAMGFRRAAESALEEVVAEDPDRASALLALGRVRIDLAREEAALEPLERRIELGASDPETYVLYARALAACGRPKEAFAAFERAFELGEEDPFVLVCGASLYLDGRLLGTDPALRERCFELMLRAVEVDPQLTVGHLFLGRLHEEEGRHGQALARYRRAVETDPAHAEALTRMALALERTDQPEKAAEIAATALQFQEDPDARKELERLAAYVVEEAGDPDE